MPTRDELANALRQADAAGNADDARRLAQAIKAMDAQSAPQPVRPPTAMRPVGAPQPPQPVPTGGGMGPVNPMVQMGLDAQRQAAPNAQPRDTTIRPRDWSNPPIDPLRPKDPAQLAAYLDRTNRAKGLIPLTTESGTEWIPDPAKQVAEESDRRWSMVADARAEAAQAQSDANNPYLGFSNAIKNNIAAPAERAIGDVVKGGMDWADPERKVSRFVSENVTPLAEKAGQGIGNMVEGPGGRFGGAASPVLGSITGGLSEFYATGLRDPMDAASQANQMLNPTIPLSEGYNQIVDASGDLIDGATPDTRQKFIQGGVNLATGGIGMVPGGSLTVDAMRAPGQAERAALATQRARVLEGVEPPPVTSVPPTAPRPQPAQAATVAPAAATPAQVAQAAPQAAPVATQTATTPPPPIQPPNTPPVAMAPAAGPAVPPAGNLVPVPQNEAVAAFNALPPKTREAMLRTLQSAGMDKDANTIWSRIWRGVSGQFRNSSEAMDAIRQLGNMPEDRQVMFALELMKNHGGDLETILPAMGRKFATEGARKDQMIGGVDRAREIMDQNVPGQINAQGEYVTGIAEDGFGPGVVPANAALETELDALSGQYEKLLDTKRSDFGRLRSEKSTGPIVKALEGIRTFLKDPNVVHALPQNVKLDVMLQARKDILRLNFTPEQMKVILAGDGKVLGPLFDAHGPLQWSPQLWDHLVTQYPKQAAHSLQSALRESADTALQNGDNSLAKYLRSLRGESGKGGLLDMLERALPGKGGKVDGEGGYRWTRQQFGDAKSAQRAFDILKNFRAAAQNEGDLAGIISELKDLPARHREAAENQITSLIRQELGRKVDSVKLSELGNPDRPATPNLTALSNQNFLNALEDVFGSRGKELADGIRLARASTDTLTSMHPKYNSRTTVNTEDVAKAGSRYEDPAGIDGGIADNTVKVLGATAVPAAVMAPQAAPFLIAGAGGKALYNAWKRGKLLSNEERNQLVEYLFRTRKAGDAPTTARPRTINGGSLAASTATNAAIGGAIGAGTSNGDPNATAAGIVGGALVGAGRKIARGRSTIIRPPPRGPRGGGRSFRPVGSTAVSPPPTQGAIGRTPPDAMGFFGGGRKPPKDPTPPPSRSIPPGGGALNSDLPPPPKERFLVQSDGTQKSLGAVGPQKTIPFVTPSGKKFQIEFMQDGDAIAVDFREQGAKANYKPTGTGSLAEANEILSGVQRAIQSDVSELGRPRYMFVGETPQQSRIYQHMARTTEAPKGYRWEGPDDNGAVFLQREDVASSKLTQNELGGSKLPMDEASRMERAREQGFDVDTPLYHGSETAGFSEFKPADPADFRNRDKRIGIYLTENRRNAQSYAGPDRDAKILDAEDFSAKDDGSPGIYKVYIRKGDQLDVDWGGKNWDEGPESEGFTDINDAARYAKDAGYDSIRVRNISDEGPHGQGYNWGNETIVVFDPANIRSVNATFDPSQQGSSKLLAGIGNSAAPEIATGLGSAGVASMQDPDTNHDGVVSDEERAAHNAGIGGSLIAGVVGAHVARGGINKLRGVGAPRPRGPAQATFAGVNAKTADLKLHRIAQDMEKAGASRDQIWKETGWFKGVDGKWRFEIDDSGARLRSNEEVAAIGDSMVQGAKDLEGRVKQSNADLREQPDLFPAALKRVHADMRQRAKGMREKANENFGPTWNEYNGRRLEYDLDHPAMIAAYPQLARDIVISRPGPSRFSPGLKGSYTDNRIKLNGPRNSDQTSTTVHEVQHALQEAEGFATGGSPESAYMTDGLRQEWAQEIDKILTPAPYEKFAANPVFEGVAEAEVRRQYKAMVAEMRAASKDIYHPLSKTVQHTAAYNIYKRLAGETEARNVQTRRDFAPEQRRAQAPWTTQDVPDDQQIVRFGGGKSESAPIRSNGFGGSTPRAGLPNVRGGWSLSKIDRALKGYSGTSNSGKRSLVSAVKQFDSAEDLAKNVYYHGSSSYIDKGLTPGSALPARHRENFGGGYGEVQHTISLSSDRNMASNFTAQSDSGYVYPTILRKDAKVIDRPDLSDAIEVEDELVKLWDDGVDAVRIGDHTKPHSEKELVVLNPRALVKLKGEGFPVFKKKRFENLSPQEVEEIWKMRDYEFPPTEIRPPIASQTTWTPNAEGRWKTLEDALGRKLTDEEKGIRPRKPSAATTAVPVHRKPPQAMGFGGKPPAQKGPPKPPMKAEEATLAAALRKARTAETASRKRNVMRDNRDELNRPAEEAVMRAERDLLEYRDRQYRQKADQARWVDRGVSAAQGGKKVAGAIGRAAKNELMKDNATLAKVWGAGSVIGGGALAVASLTGKGESRKQAEAIPPTDPRYFFEKVKGDTAKASTIQNALVAVNMLESKDADGRWGGKSADALKAWLSNRPNRNPKLPLQDYDVPPLLAEAYGGYEDGGKWFYNNGEPIVFPLKTEPNGLPTRTLRPDELRRINHRKRADAQGQH